MKYKCKHCGNEEEIDSEYVWEECPECGKLMKSEGGPYSGMMISIPGNFKAV